ncbi:hypothetical protein HYH02_002279 [Chlamydomonas schloesseri]|uniref:Large ribosomal subunit protein mL45 n=1 Tax=Chlamydomonas schloesseri TaxID=2026947 RepID=A0A835WT30_9CHLO|nr:hypothetical protein HYH02_002279 [Chlamydomonas schloesseri]|eukprot:KAG2452942.1 hypothetical protein HYH02_002279 [Chlamydomonas schloesseri]
MASRQGAGTLMRALGQQAGLWCARPAGSLITAPASTSGAAGSLIGLEQQHPQLLQPQQQHQQLRHMSRIPAAFTSGFNPFAWFDYRKMVYPEVYDANEAHLWARYKSHGGLAERYSPPGRLTHANPLADPEMEARIKYWSKGLYAGVVCRTSIWGFSAAALQQRVVDAYKAVNAALAAGDMALAEPYVTEQMGLRLAGDVARRGRASVTWRLVREPKPSDIELVHGTIVKNPLKQGKLHFAQWTARIPSRQVVAVYDNRGKLLAGDPDKELDVVDHWVFERPILKAWIMPRPGPSGAEWRLVERLQ